MLRVKFGLRQWLLISISLSGIACASILGDEYEIVEKDASVTAAGGAAGLAGGGGGGRAGGSAGSIAPSAGGAGPPDPAMTGSDAGGARTHRPTQGPPGGPSR